MALELSTLGVNFLVKETLFNIEQNLCKERDLFV